MTNKSGVHGTKVGDVVQIFNDPLEELKPEGEAELVELLIADCGCYLGRRQQRWRVRFSDDPSATYTRFILTPKGEA